MKNKKCEICGIGVNNDNWGRIDFAKGIVFCRKCLKEVLLAEKLHNSLVKYTILSNNEKTKNEN